LILLIRGVDRYKILSPVLKTQIEKIIQFSVNNLELPQIPALLDGFKYERVTPYPFKIELSRDRDFIGNIMRFMQDGIIFIGSPK